MYFDEKAADYYPVFCSDCDQHIMIGSDQLESRFESILTKFSIKEASGTAKEEFLEAIEFILFFAAFEPVITSSARFSKRVAKNLNIAGCAENIELWRAWTPNQQILVKSNVQKVIFISAPSTGKTTLMTEEAYYLGSKSEKAAFFIPSTFGANRKTLLALSMQHQFQNYFDVCSVKRRTKGMAVRVVEFSSGGTKLERFLPKNQHTQRKLLNFEFWINGKLSKIRHHFSNKVI